MANKRVTDLPSATSVGSADKFHVVQNGTDKQATATVVLKSVNDRIDEATSVSNSTLTASGLSISFKKKNGVVCVRINGQTSEAISANVSIGTIPTGFIPDSSFEFAAYNGSVPTNVIPCILGSDGTVKFRTSVAASVYLRGGAAYL